MIISDFKIKLSDNDPDTQAETITIDNILESFTGYEVSIKLITETETNVFRESTIVLVIKDVKDGYDEIYDKLINPNSRIRNLLKAISTILHSNYF